MLIDNLLYFISLLLGGIFNLFPSAKIEDLPFVGSSLSDFLVSISGYWHTFMETFPYALVVWDCFIYVIIPFEILIFIAKLFFGSRLPAHLN